VLAAKERTDELSFLAAGRVSGRGSSLRETRVRGLPPGNQTGIGGCWPVTSILVWGCWNLYDGTASGSLDQRYYASSYGRFNSPDPYKASGGPADPGSWNRYSYTGGDPVNRLDPHGTYWIYEQDGGWCSTLDYSGDCYGPEIYDTGCLENPVACAMTYSALFAVPPGGGGGGGGPTSQPQSCGQVNPDGTSAEQDKLSVLFGEDSWTVRGQPYSASTVARETK
jgi:RHS repeat-associated protein